MHYILRPLIRSYIYSTIFLSPRYTTLSHRSSPRSIIIPSVSKPAQLRGFKSGHRSTGWLWQKGGAGAGWWKTLTRLWRTTCKHVPTFSSRQRKEEPDKRFFILYLYRYTIFYTYKELESCYSKPAASAKVRRGRGAAKPCTPKRNPLRPRVDRATRWSG